MIKFNKRVYPFNSSNFNFSNNKTNTEEINPVPEKNLQNNSNCDNENMNLNTQENIPNLKISDLLMDNIISEMKNIKDDSNLKNYLKNRISNIISKNIFFLFFNILVSQNKEENNQKFEEVEKKLDLCEKEKNKFTKVISFLYDKTIVIFKY